jgi:abhydrolase domain-containing protein 17
MDKTILKRWLIGDFSLKRMIASFLFIYGFLFILGIFSNPFLFPRPPCSYEKLEGGMEIQTGDGHSLYAVYLPNPKARWTLLYFHGNAEDLGDIFPVLEMFYKHGFSVFAWDYRGYGKSSGTPSEKTCYEDLEVIQDTLVHRLQIKPEHLIMYGRSIGGGPAAEFAVRYEKAAMILESTFTSAFRVLTRIKILPFDKFDTLKKIRVLHCPLLFIHGTKDEVIPFRQGLQLFASALEPKQHYWVENAGHNDLLWVAGENYWKTLSGFLTRIAGNRPGKPDR